MNDPQTEHEADREQPSELWLGYADLLVPFAEISALLQYQAAWDRRIAQDYGRVPGDVQAVVLLKDGHVLPARRALADLHERWIRWQTDTAAPENETA